MKTLTVQPKENQMLVTFDDVSVMQQVKKAIALMRGVKSVTMPRKKKSELDICLEEVNDGKVVNVGSVDELMQYLHS